ncbi:MAG TPA: cation diffusion facilitator family transporter [Thermoplasmata archaeon]|nr:cation diffusion facilitator family transporter [Thermoplasmata archaeon]
MHPGRSQEAHAAPHAHTHGVVDPVTFTSARGIWAVRWSFVGMIATASVQLVIFAFTGSVALLSDTIHNFGDAATAIPLWAAFRVGRRRPNDRFTYGYGRVEDLAGISVVGAIGVSAILAGYVSMERLFHPGPVLFPWAVAAASAVGFLGNEFVARFRIRVGKEIGSVALVADGYHARADGLTSLAVLGGAIGVSLGQPLADPIVGLVIAVAIVRVLWQSGKPVLARLLDAVDPDAVEEIRRILKAVPGVVDVTDVRVRWIGHRLHTEVNLAVDGALSVERGHEIAKHARHGLMHLLGYLSTVTIHVDPADASGESYHRTEGHVHDDLPAHPH